MNYIKFCIVICISKKYVKYHKLQNDPDNILLNSYIIIYFKYITIL